MFDPRYVEKALVKRNEESKDSALQFASDLEAGKLDASMPNFNQGLFDLAPEAISKKENPAAVEGEDASMPDQEGSGFVTTYFPCMAIRCTQYVTLTFLLIS